MSDNKKYYYLKLKENFYDSDSMILLESMENGYLYSNILMKMYLRSLKGEGKLMLNDRIPFNPIMLSKIVRHNVDVVEKAIKVFKELELIEILDNGAIYMLDIQNFIGQSSTEADRQRIYYNQIKENKEACKISYKKPCKISTPEIEIELEIEKELEKDIELDKKKKLDKEKAKNIYGEFSHVKLTNEELNKLKETYGTSKTEEYITRLDEYLENNKKKKYGSHYLTIRNWIRKEQTNETKPKRKDDGFWEAIAEIEKGVFND